jgi:putative transposase
MLTPEMPHYGMAAEVIGQRQQVLDAAYARNPERFTHTRPVHPPQPTAAWINHQLQHMRQREIYTKL